MTSEELRRLICKNEGLKLDFKREYKLQSMPPDGADRQLWNQYIKGQWDELIKDILALTNGNVGVAKEAGILIIGVDDQLQPDGSRQLFDSSYLEITGQQILSKVNSACYPPIPQLACEFVELDGRNICIISIPPSPYVHETTRQLETTKGEFDHQGKLRHVKPGKTYTSHTAFIRRGEDVLPATGIERRKLEEEKNLFALADPPVKSAEKDASTKTEKSASFKKSQARSISKQTQTDLKISAMVAKLEDSIVKPIKVAFPVLVGLGLVVITVAIYILFLMPNEFVFVLLVLSFPVVGAFLLYPVCFSIFYSRLKLARFYLDLSPDERLLVKRSLQQQKRRNSFLEWYVSWAIMLFVVIDKRQAESRHRR